MGGYSNLYIIMYNLNCTDEEWDNCVEEFHQDFVVEWFEEDYGDDEYHETCNDKEYSVEKQQVLRGYSFGDSGIKDFTTKYKIKVEVYHSGDFSPYDIHYENGSETYNSREMERQKENEYQVMKKMIEEDENLKKKFEELMKKI